MEANTAIESNEALLYHYKKLMQAISSQLLRDSTRFKMFEGGLEKDFNIDETLEL